MSQSQREYMDEIQRTLNQDPAYRQWLNDLDKFGQKYNRPAIGSKNTNTTDTTHIHNNTTEEMI